MHKFCMNIENVTHVVWDWNGTLLCDVDICIETANELLEERGLTPIQSVENYRSIFTFPVVEYYKSLGFQFTLESFSDVAEAYVRRYEDKLMRCTLYPGTLDTLQKLQQAGYSQTLISASGQRSLQKQITGRNIDEFFSEILGLRDNLASSKMSLAKAWLGKNNISPSNVLLIGDTVHDFEVSQAVGCSSILIANGHQSMERLTKTGAEVIPNISRIQALLACSKPACSVF